MKGKYYMPTGQDDTFLDVRSAFLDQKNEVKGAFYGEVYYNHKYTLHNNCLFYMQNVLEVTPIMLER